MNALKKLLVTVVAVTMLLAQLLNPIRASADGETTPPPVESSDVTKPPAPTDVPTETVSTETPVASDVPKVETVSTDVPTITPLTEETATELPVVESSTITPADSIEKPTLLEVIEEIPSETTVVVLDENGQPLSLTTQDASDVVASGDPMWCPSGVSPIANSGGCTASRSTMQELLTNDGAYINGQNVNGTIWISSGPIGDTTAVTIDGTTYTNWTNYALTLQGGWTGTNSGTIDANQNSIFTVPISIWNWLGNLTINNITIQDTAAPYSAGLDIQTTGRVTLKNSTFKNNYIGARIYATGAGNVQVSNSTFTENQWDGLEVFTSSYPEVSNNITVSNSWFSYNNRNNTDGYGLWLITDSIDSGSLTANHFINNERGASISGSPISVAPDNEFDLNCLDYSINFTIPIFPPYYYYSFYYEQPGNYCGDPLPPPAPVAPVPALSTRGLGKFNLDCKSQGGFSVPLPNGDLVQIFCPVSGEAEIARLDNTILPKPLPDGYTYASAFELKILQAQEPINVINDTGYIRASFIASDLNSPGNEYSILYWDPIEKDWVVLKDYMRDGNGSRSFYLDPEDPTRVDVRRKIISGVQLVTSHKDERVEVSTNFPGIFVLAQH